MKLIFLYGPAASGKLTIAREVAAFTGLPVFHNHLVVDALLAVFPFGSAPFVELRERFWMDVFAAAAAEGRSLVFTFAPEQTVRPDFPRRAEAIFREAGGDVAFVKLAVSAAEQERRLTDPSRGEFAKLKSVELLRELRSRFDYDAIEAAMPAPRLEVDTMKMTPSEAARRIVDELGLSTLG